MKKVLMSFLVIAVSLLIVIIAAKNTIAKIAVEKGVQAVTGLRLSVDKINVGLVDTLVGIDELKIYNPSGYEDPLMLDMPEIYVDYDLPALFRQKIHLNEVRIDLKTFVVVKNAKGELNLDALKPVKAEKKPAAKTAEPEGVRKEAAVKGRAMEMKIDSLSLKIGKVIYKDYSKGGTPSVQEFNLNLDETYQNIDDPQKLVSLIVVKALMNTTIAKLVNFDLSSLQNSLGGSLAGMKQLTGVLGSGQQAAETLKGATDAAKKAAEGLLGGLKAPAGTGAQTPGAADTVKKAADDLFSSFKMPGGAEE